VLTCTRDQRVFTTTIAPDGSVLANVALSLDAAPSKAASALRRGWIAA